MKKIAIYILIMVGAINWLSAQIQLSTKSKKAANYYYQADNYLMLRQYPQAIEVLLLAIKKDEKFIEAIYRLGYAYKLIKDIPNAEKYLSKAVEMKPDDLKMAGLYFHMGDTYFRKNQYTLAIKYLEKFLSYDPGGQTPEKARQILKNCRFAEEKMKLQLKFNPELLSENINQFPLQYFPVLTADQNTIIYTRRYGSTPQYDEDIVFSVRGEDGVWSLPMSISDNINTRYNEGTCTISADGRIMIFTSCFGRRVIGSCDLFISFLEGQNWSDPVNLGPNVNSKAWESQPSLSADGRTLYFVSDRGNGMGKRDIWVSNLNDEDQWDKPVNLGPKINSGQDEVSPFIHANGQTLYFASAGRLGFGGFDLYYSELSENGWKIPENLGYPINNSDDQVSLFITADGKKGYYSDEKIKDQFRVTSKLYVFDIPEEIQVSHKSNFVKGKVFDAKTRKPIQASIELFTLENNKLLSKVKSDSFTGDYVMVLTEGSEYALYVAKPNYLFESLSFNYVGEINHDPINIDIYLNPIEDGISTRLNNIFFDIDKYDIKEKSTTELNRIITFLKQNPTIGIIIEGHTDNSGESGYNLDLSEKRAKAVHGYLISKGAESERLSFKGYGQEKPVAPNDSEADRKLNRRIEFRIVKRL